MKNPPEISTAGASTLGADIPQVTARAKVLGRAMYAGDIKVPGMLHGKVLRSPYPHARIVSIDVWQALALPGVKAVLTGADAPRAMWGVHHKERRILAEGIVRFAGEEVAAVAATTEEIARDALDLIRVEYEELPAILTPEEAMDEEAPGVHPGRNNISHEIRFERGDVDAGFASAHVVHEATYDTHAQYPGYLEPMGTVANIDPEGRLVVWTSTQSITQARLRLAASLERPISSIRVIQATTGGGFGGKMVEDANNLIAGLLAVKTGKPVRVVNNRLEDFLACCSSVPERITLKLGMDQSGTIVAKDVRIIAECGAYSGLSAEVMHVTAMRSDNMHRNPNVRSHATLVYTNNPPHGAFRGFGGTQMQFALNSHIHTMAGMLGLDPVDIHKRNAIRKGEVSIRNYLDAILPRINSWIVLGLLTALLLIVLHPAMKRHAPLAATLVRLTLGTLVFYVFESVVFEWAQKHLEIYQLQLLSNLFQSLWWLVPALWVIALLPILLWDPIERRTGYPVSAIARTGVNIAVLLVSGACIMAFVFDQPLTSVWAASGVLTVVLGIALQSLILDAFAGLMLSAERPFSIGDWVALRGARVQTPDGRVEEMNWRTTRMWTRDNNILVIPNSAIAQSTVINYSAESRASRLDISIVLETDIPVPEALEALVEGAQPAIGSGQILAEPRPKAVVEKIESFGICYKVQVHHDMSTVSRDTATTAVVDSLMRHLAKRGIRTAWPKEQIAVASGHGWPPEERTVALSALPEPSKTAAE